MTSHANKSDIRFSQKYISNPGTKWNLLKYKPMDVVVHQDDSITSFDNRRLFRARETTDTDSVMLEVNKHFHRNELPEGQSERFKFWIGFSDNASGTYLLNLLPKTFEAALAARCSLQSDSFSLTGEVTLPLIERRRSSHVWKGTKTKGLVEESKLTDLLLNANEIVSLLERWSVSIVNIPMQSFLKSSRERFTSLYEIEESVYYVDYTFLKGGAEWFHDWDEEKERKLDQLRDDRDKEIINDRNDKYAECLIEQSYKFTQGTEPSNEIKEKRINSIHMTDEV